MVITEVRFSNFLQLCRKPVYITSILKKAFHSKRWKHSLPRLELHEYIVVDFQSSLNATEKLKTRPYTKSRCPSSKSDDVFIRITICLFIPKPNTPISHVGNQ